MNTLATSLPAPARPRRRLPLPGFGLSLGLGLAWMSLIVLLPLAALAWRAAGLGLDGWLHAIHDPRVQASLKLSFGVGNCFGSTSLGSTGR
jgi:sulfate transport system permease protein